MTYPRVHKINPQKFTPRSKALLPLPIAQDAGINLTVNHTPRIITIQKLRWNPIFVGLTKP